MQTLEFNKYLQFQLEQTNQNLPACYPYAYKLCLDPTCSLPALFEASSNPKEERFSLTVSLNLSAKLHNLYLFGFGSSPLISSFVNIKVSKCDSVFKVTSKVTEPIKVLQKNADSSSPITIAFDDLFKMTTDNKDLAQFQGCKMNGYQLCKDQYCNEVVESSVSRVYLTSRAAIFTSKQPQPNFKGFISARSLDETSWISMPFEYEVCGYQKLSV